MAQPLLPAGLPADPHAPHSHTTLRSHPPNRKVSARWHSREERRPYFVWKSVGMYTSFTCPYRSNASRRFRLSVRSPMLHISSEILSMLQRARSASRSSLRRGPKNQTCRDGARIARPMRGAPVCTGLLLLSPPERERFIAHIVSIVCSFITKT